MPSSTAALAELKASETLSFFSPTSVSLAPPTCTEKIIFNVPNREKDHANHNTRRKGGGVMMTLTMKEKENLNYSYTS